MFIAKLRSKLALVILSAFIIYRPSPLCAEGAAGEIAVLIKGLSNPYWKALEQGALQAAKDLQQPIYLQGVLSDSDTEGQLNLCSTMLLRKPKILITAAVNSYNLAPCFKHAAARGVLLADVDGGTRQEDAEKIGVKFSFSTASDNYQLGALAARYLKGKRGKVLLIEGFFGSGNALLRAKGFKENLPSELNIIASLPGDWDRLKAAQITTDIITKHPDLAAIFAANDLMALGAAEALSARGIHQVSVIGVDGIKDAIKAIKSGKLTASVAQLPYLIGYRAVEAAQRALSGEKIDFEQKVPIVTIDGSVLQNNNEPLLAYLR